jgi:hypothetical protein
MLVTILGIVGTTAGQALLAISKTPKQADAALIEETALVSKMESMRSLSFDNLTIGTALADYSDNTVSVDVAYGDPSGGGAQNTNWKQITVRLAGGRQLTTFVSKP